MGYRGHMDPCTGYRTKIPDLSAAGVDVAADVGVAGGEVCADVPLVGHRKAAVGARCVSNVVYCSQSSVGRLGSNSKDALTRHWSPGVELRVKDLGHDVRAHAVDAT